MSGLVGLLPASGVFGRVAYPSGFLFRGSAASACVLAVLVGPAGELVGLALLGRGKWQP